MGFSNTIGMKGNLNIDTTKMEAAVKRADKLLYACKHNGRNCLRLG